MRSMTYLVLAAVLFQGVFGSLHGSVVICLGGGHEHEVVEAVEAPPSCASGCSHHHAHPHPHPHTHSHHQHPTTPVEHEHESGCCQCTDIEIGLLALQSTPRQDAAVMDVLEDPAPSITQVQLTQDLQVLPGPPFIRTHDPGIAHRLSIVRTTRLLV